MDGVISGGHLLTQGYSIPISFVNATLIADALHRLADRNLLSVVQSVRIYPDSPAVHREWRYRFDWPNRINGVATGITYCTQNSRTRGVMNIEKHALIYSPTLVIGQRHSCEEAVSVTALSVIRGIIPLICKDERRTSLAIAEFLRILNSLHPDLPDQSAGVPVGV